MKKITFLSFFIIFNLSAQNYTGFLTDNYAGVHNVLNNPAEIVDSKYRTDISIFSLGINASNDFYSFDLFEALKSDVDFESISDKSLSNSNSLHVNYDILGPSFMMNLTPRSSIALFTRGRGLLHATDIDGAYLEDLEDNGDSSYSVQNQNFSIASNSWVELGVSYAHILKDSPHHKVKIGGSAKYLLGLYSGYLKANNFSVAFNPNGNADGVYTTSGSIETGNISNFDDIESPDDFSGSGFAVDLGISYEYRPQIHYYKYKLAASITDLGYINYKETEVRRFDANAIVSESDFNSADFDTFFTVLSTSNSFRTVMPTALKTQADFNFNNRFFLNLSTQFNLNDRTKENSNYLTNRVLLTPRLQYKWLSLYMPIGYTQYAGAQAGFGFRAGPLVIGSGSIVSSVFEKTKVVDVYAALKIPVFRKKGTKDADFFK